MGKARNIHFHLGPIAASGRAGTLYSTDAPDTTLTSFKAQGTTNAVGGNMPMDIRNPYLGTYFCDIAAGDFPEQELTAQL